MIESWHVREALRSRLGSSLVDEPGFADRRIRTAVLRDAADDVMGVFFDQLKVYSVNYEALQAYVLESGSFSAMRTLYTRYATLMSAEERRVLARIIREARPACDWEEWLPGSSDVSGGAL